MTPCEQLRLQLEHGTHGTVSTESQGESRTSGPCPLPQNCTDSQRIPAGDTRNYVVGGLAPPQVNYNGQMLLLKSEVKNQEL